MKQEPLYAGSLPQKYEDFRAWLLETGYADVGLSIPYDFEDIIHGRGGLHSALVVAGELRFMQAIHAYAEAYEANRASSLVETKSARPGEGNGVDEL